MILSTLLLAAALAATPGDTVTAAPPDTLPRVVEIPEITVTASRSRALIVETQEEVRVVSETAARDRLSASLPDALGECPEIHMQRTNLGGGAPVLRGFVGNRVLLMVDDIRLNTSTYRLGPNQYLNTVDQGAVDRVETVTGPASVLYGSDAMGGVVNILTASPRSDAPLLRYTGQVTTAEGSQTHSLRMNRWWGNGGLVLGGSFRDYNDFRGGGDIGIQEPTGYTDWSGNAKLEAEPRPNDWLTLGYQITREDDVPRTDRVVAGRDSINQYDPQHRELAFARYESVEPVGGVASGRLTLSWNHQREGRQVVAVGSRTLLDEIDDVNTFGGALEGRSSLSRGTLFIYGAEVYQDVVASGATRINLNDSTETPAVGKLPDDGGHLSTGAFFRVQDPLTDQLKVIGGLRHSYFHLYGTPQGPFGKVNAYNRNFTGSLESQFLFARDSFVFAGLSQAFRAPSMEDALATSLTNRGYDVPNPTIEPEKSLSIEAGVKMTGHHTGSDPARRGEPWAWHLAFTAHTTRILDLAERVPSTFLGSDSLLGQPVFRIENVGTGRIHGASVQAEAWPWAGVRLAGGASLTYGENTTRDTPLTRMPPVRGNLAARRNLARGWIESAAEWALEQDRLSPEDERDTRIPAGGTPGYFVLHLRGGWPVRRDVDLRAVFGNVFDTEWRVHGSGIDMPGRNLTLGLEWRFDQGS